MADAAVDVELDIDAGVAIPVAGVGGVGVVIGDAFVALVEVFGFDEAGDGPGGGGGVVGRLGFESAKPPQRRPGGNGGFPAA